MISPFLLDWVIRESVRQTCDEHALLLLAACYLPGVLAAWLQLARRTKYSQFPAWLDSWLRIRKGDANNIVVS